jgi:hypothetical protein
MSFFGFDPSMPRDRGHSSNAPGFGQHDAFAALGGGAANADVYVVMFHTYSFLLTPHVASTSKRRTTA